LFLGYFLFDWCLAFLFSPVATITYLQVSAILTVITNKVYRYYRANITPFSNNNALNYSN
jgi:hypothetical protein